MISLSQNEPEKYAEIYAAHTKKVEKYNEDMRSFDLRFPIFENEYSNYDGYGDMSLFSDVNEAVSRQKSYENKLRLLLRDAVTRLRETDEDSYFYSYYVELCLLLHSTDRRKAKLRHGSRLERILLAGHHDCTHCHSGSVNTVYSLHL